MKIIDLRNTQSHGWVADVLLSPRSILPVSIPVLECDPYALIDYANNDKMHINKVINWHGKVVFNIDAIAENIREYSNMLKARIESRKRK